jgi:diguanylate cyclase (GGDEF)-like protein/PAS domain S-box-containing protein
MSINPLYNLLIWLLLLLSLAGSGLFSFWMKGDIEARERQQFFSDCQEIQLKIIARLKAHEQTLLGGAALFDASDNVTRQEWKAYAKRLRISDHFNGIQGLGFSLWIPVAQLASHEAAVRAEGFPAYQVRPQGQRLAYTSIVYLEPFAERNLRAFGYDMYSEPVRRVAMAYARDENRATLSGKVILVQETAKEVQAGTLMYVPVYRKGKPLDTVEQRRTALIGWVYSPFRMTDLLNNIVASSNAIEASEIHLRVYDGNTNKVANLLYDSDPKQAIFSAPISIHSVFNGTLWTLQFTKNRNINGLYNSKVWITASTSVIISLLLFLLSRSYLTTRLHAAQIATQLTKELKESEGRFRVLADNAPVLIWLAGLDKQCYHVNKVWLDFTGRTLAQEIGNGWAQSVHPDDFERFFATYVTAFDARFPFAMEYRLRRYDGEYRWILNNGVPRFAEDATFLGYIGSCIDISERKQAESALRRESEKNQAFLRNASDGIHILDPEGNLLEFSDSFCEMLGYQREEMVGMNVTEWDVNFSAADCLRVVKRQFEKPIRSEFQTRHCCKDGTVIDVEVSGFPLMLAGKPALFNSSRNITDRKQAERQLKIAATVFEAQEGMLISDANQLILNVNQAFSRITGYISSEVIGQTPRLLKSNRHDKAFYSVMWQSIQQTGLWQGEIWNRRKNGQVYPEWLTITAVKANNDQQVTHYVATFTDMTERKAAEDYINQLAFYDPLTQLPNRRLLYERLKHGFSVSSRNGSQMAVLMMDLDKFKAVNDTLGHAAGDELLQQVAKRMKACLREVDLVARLGGDEFVVLLENITQTEHVAPIAQAILDTLSQPFTLHQNHIACIGASIGIALYPEHGDTIEMLIDHADTALYCAKDNGRNCFVAFSEK